jgi:hypothetical protein
MKVDTICIVCDPSFIKIRAGEVVKCVDLTLNDLKALSITCTSICISEIKYFLPGRIKIGLILPRDLGVGIMYNVKRQSTFIHCFSKQPEKFSPKIPLFSQASLK